MSIGLYVVDDHPVVQAGIDNVFVDDDEFVLLGAAETLATAVVAVGLKQPDVILLDVRLGGTDVTDAVRGLLRAAPSARIVLFTADPQHPRIPSARRAGAVATVPKDVPPAQLRKLVREAHAGRLGGEPEQDRPLLTSRQLDVLVRVANGLTNHEIAVDLHLSPTTVKTYWQEALQRLGARNRADAISVAHRRGLL